MAKKKKASPSKPSNAYLISFGDTMTALLAFFIVINSLAKEQTGANLYSGTGSFVNAMNSMGLPGNIQVKASENTFQREQPGPLYIVGDDEDQDRGNGTGPDDVDNGLRVVDREKEMLQRFLVEIGQLGSVSNLRDVRKEVVFDLFEKIEKQSPVVSREATRLFRQAAMQLDQNTRIEIVVWASNPGKRAWSKAVHEAAAVKADLILRTGLPADQVYQVDATGKPWFYSDEKRPRFSIIVKKLK